MYGHFSTVWAAVGDAALFTVCGRQDRSVEGIIAGVAVADQDPEKGDRNLCQQCAAYEKQSYIEGMKTGARLMMELAED